MMISLLFSGVLSAQTSCDDKKMNGKAFMGIHFDELSPEKAEKLKFDNPHGYYITKIEQNSAAEKAGLQPFDYVYRIDELDFTADAGLNTALREKAPEDEITVYYVRQGKDKNTRLTLGSSLDRTFSVKDPMQKAFLGVSQTYNEDEENCAGVKVKIVSGSPAEEMGLQDGDVITYINEYRVVDWGDISTAMATVDADKSVEVRFLRDDKKLKTSGDVITKQERIERKAEQIEERALDRARQMEERAEQIEERAKERSREIEERAKERAEAHQKHKEHKHKEHQHKQHQKHDYAFLGIHSDHVSDKKAEMLGFDNPYGTYVTKVLDNTAAQKGGIEIFDYIYGIDEYRVGEDQSLGSILRKYQPGDKAEVKVIRQGKKVSKSVTFGRKSDAQYKKVSKCDQPLFGINKSYEEGDKDLRGVRVNIVENSTAKEMGLQDGSVITAINDYPMLDWGDITTAIDALAKGDQIKVAYTVNGAKKTNSLPIKSYQETKQCEDCCDEHKKEWGNIDIDLEDMDFNFDNDIDINWENGSFTMKSAEPRANISEMEVEMHDLTSDEMERLRDNGVNTANVNNLTIKQLNVFPNPSNGLFNLQFDMPDRGDTKVLIYNNAGRQIYSYELSSFSGRFEDVVDISQNGAGSYYLAITQNGKTMTKKIVLK